MSQVFHFSTAVFPCSAFTTTLSTHSFYFPSCLGYKEMLQYVIEPSIRQQHCKVSSRRRFTVVQPDHPDEHVALQVLLDSISHQPIASVGVVSATKTGGLQVPHPSFKRRRQKLKRTNMGHIPLPTEPSYLSSRWHSPGPHWHYVATAPGRIPGSPGTRPAPGVFGLVGPASQYRAAKEPQD